MSQHAATSWVIREKATHKVLFETFDRRVVDALKVNRYEAVPILKYLQSLNRNQKRAKP